MGLSDKDIKTWDQRLIDQVRLGWENYKHIRIDLTTARTDQSFNFAGEFIYVEATSSALAVAKIKLNRNTNDALDFELGTFIKTIFVEVFITNTALQGEWLDIVVGINFDYLKEQPVAINIPVPLVVGDGGGSLSVDDNGGSLTVDGTFWQATQPVSAAALPLPAGAATAALQLPNGHNVVIPTPVPVTDNAGSLTVDGTFWQATQPVSAAALPLPAGAATSALQTQPGVDVGDVTVNNAAGAAAVNVQDGGNSLTVDGTFWQATQPVSAAALPLPAGAATSALQTQPGVDVGDVTVNNAAGAAAVNVQDGGNSLTVDGAITAVDNGIAQPCITITNANADQNTVGANHACKRVLIRAHTINTGLVWVDFNAAAVALACYPLAAGDSVSVPLTNTNLVNCLFKVANEKVTVVYTN